MEQGTTATAYLPDELVVEILARLPAKSLCRFKCVSKHWRRLISDPAHRTRLAQTLSGFFYVSKDPAWRFAGLPSSVTPLEGDGGPPLVDTALSFLPPSCGPEIEILDSCNGLLLLLCSNDGGFSPPPPFYVVCNPATREWVHLPQPGHTPGQDAYCSEYGGDVITWYAAVGFDPVVSSHFYVFQVVDVNYTTQPYLRAVEIYSSETGTWVLKERKCEGCIFLGRMTYFDGFLHLPVQYDGVVTMDNNGQSWRVTQGDHCSNHGRGYVGHSQGCLLYVNNAYKNDIMSVYILENQDSEEWTLKLKHSVRKPDLLFERWKSMMRPTYYIAGFHPHSDSIFFYDRTLKRLISYDMNRGDWHVVCGLQDFEHAHHPFFPYVPWYSRGLASPNIN